MGLYERMPIWIQNVAISLTGIRLYNQRYGKAYKKHMKICKEWNAGSKELQKQIQSDELQKLLAYTINNSVFYKNLYKQQNISEIKTEHQIEILQCSV